MGICGPWGVVWCSGKIRVAEAMTQEQETGGKKSWERGYARKIVKRWRKECWKEER